MAPVIGQTSHKRGAAECAMGVLGACVLLPYNCLLTAQPYFDQHAFKDMEFPFTCMLVYSFFLCATQVFLTINGDRFTVRARAAGGLYGGGLMSVALLAVSLAAHAHGHNTVLYILCLASVAALAVCNSLLQTAILGVAGAMGPEISGAVMVGLGVAGPLALVASLAVQGVEAAKGNVSEATGEAGVIVAVSLFGMCIVYSAISVWLFFGYLSTREPRTVAAVQMLEDRRAARTSPQARTLVAAAAADACVDGAAVSTEDGEGVLPVLREIAVQAANVFVAFATTCCVFPGVVTQWVPGSDSLMANNRQLFGTLLIGTFQVFDVLSRAAAAWGAKHISPGRLWMHVAVRLVFIPLFILGQRKPDACALWGSDWGRFLLTAALAFTNGLTASCAVMFGPECAAPRRRESAGIAMSCVMVLGIFCGMLLAMPTQIGASSS